MSKMKKHEFEAAIEEGIKNMNLSHRKDLLPYIFESLDLQEYYQRFEELDDGYNRWIATEQAKTYHNKLHMKAVALNCYEAMHSTLTEFSKEDKQALTVAALYHDANHTRIAGHDSVNIGMALKALDDVHGSVNYKIPTKAYVKAQKLIRHTEYPYVVASSHISDPLSLIIRDADLMMSYEQDYVALELHMGLFNELNQKRQYANQSGLSIADFIEGNTKFLQKVEWNTRWARNKAFKYNFPLQIKELRKKLFEFNAVSL